MFLKTSTSAFGETLRGR